MIALRIKIVLVFFALLNSSSVCSVEFKMYPGIKYGSDVSYFIINNKISAVYEAESGGVGLYYLEGKRVILFSDLSELPPKEIVNYKLVGKKDLYTVSINRINSSSLSECPYLFRNYLEFGSKDGGVNRYLIVQKETLGSKVDFKDCPVSVGEASFIKEVSSFVEGVFLIGDNFYIVGGRDANKHDGVFIFNKNEVLKYGCELLGKYILSYDDVESFLSSDAVDFYNSQMKINKKVMKKGIEECR